MVHRILTEGAVRIEDVPFDEESFLPGRGLAAESEQCLMDLSIERVGLCWAAGLLGGLHTAMVGEKRGSVKTLPGGNSR